MIQCGSFQTVDQTIQCDRSLVLFVFLYGAVISVVDSRKEGYILCNEGTQSDNRMSTEVEGNDELTKKKENMFRIFVVEVCPLAVFYSLFSLVHFHSAGAVQGFCYIKIICMERKPLICIKKFMLQIKTTQE